MKASQLGKFGAAEYVTYCATLAGERPPSAPQRKGASIVHE